MPENEPVVAPRLADGPLPAPFTAKIDNVYDVFGASPPNV